MQSLFGDSTPAPQSLNHSTRITFRTENFSAEVESLQLDR
jgi:hypothetical protein